jgi:hypothetical protein
MMQSRIGTCGYAECGLHQGTTGKRKAKGKQDTLENDEIQRGIYEN